MRPRLCIVGVVVLVLCALLFPSLSMAQGIAKESVLSRLSRDNPSPQGFPVNIVQVNGSSIIRPCEVGSFAFQFQNPSADEITLDLGADPFVDGIFFSQNPVVLRPGQVKTVSLFVVPPCEYYGIFQMELLARSRKDGSQVSVAVGSLEVSSDGIMEIGKGVTKIRVDYNRSGVYIPLRNIGDIDSVYDISIDGPNWVLVRPSSLSVPAGTQSQVQMVTQPQGDIEAGVYRATVFAKAKETGVEYGKSFQIVLAPYTPQELFWNRYQAVIIALAIGVGLLVLLAAVLVVYLIRTRDARARAREERAARKEEARRAKEALGHEKEAQLLVKAKERVSGRIKEWCKRQICKDHALFRPDGTRMKTWVKPLVWTLAILVLLIAGVGILAANWARLAPYAVPFAIPFGSGVAVVLVIIMLIKLIQFAHVRRLRSRFSSDELDRLNLLARQELEKEYSLVPKSVLALARKDRPTALVAVLAVGAVACITAGIAVIVSRFRVGGWWLQAAVALFVLAVIFVMLWVAVVQHHRRRVKHTLFPSVSANQKTTVITGWSKGVNEVDLRSKIKKAGVIVSVRCFEESPSFVALDDPVYQHAEVRLEGLTEKDVQDIAIKFRVAASWLAKNRATEKDIALMRYDSAKTRWVRVADQSLIDVDEIWMSFIAKDTGVGLFAISAKQSIPESPGLLTRWFGITKPGGEDAEVAEEGKTKARGFERLESAKQKRKELELAKESLGDKAWRWGKYLVILLIAAALIGGVVYMVKTKTLPPVLVSWLQPAKIAQPTQGIVEPSRTEPVAGPQAEKKGIPDQAWRENTLHKLDLSRYFSDPDKDSLVYSHTPMKHILIEYNASIAWMTPETDFVGEAETVFIATDKSGAKAQSNQVRLVVQPGPQPFNKQVLEFVRQYAGYLVAGLIALAVIVASIVLLRKSEEKDE